MKAARILVLGVALAAGGAAAFLVGSDDEKKPDAPPAPVAQLETADVLIAKSDIGMGTPFAARICDGRPGRRPPPARATSPRKTSPTPSKSSTAPITRAPFTAGEPIREAKLIKAKGSGFMAAILPSGMRAVSTEISPETGAGGFILPNDRVDVILSRRDSDGREGSGVEVHVSETILTNVRVLAIDQTVEEKNGQRVVVGKTATLELAPRQAETLALARQHRHAVARASQPARRQQGQPKTTTSDAGGGINTVRFGVSTTDDAASEQPMTKAT